MAKRIDFFDGVTTATVPTIGSISASSLKQYANDTAYETDNGLGTAGDIYYNTSTNKVRYYDSGLGSFVDAETTVNKGSANGYASLDGSGKVPASQLPSFVDDVEEYADLASFPLTGETGKIYVDLATNMIYRWSGSVYIEISPSTGGANTALSNLMSPTAVSEDILMAATKTIRVPNDIYYKARNAANSADINVAKVNTSDQVQFGVSTILPVSNNGTDLGTSATKFNQVNSNEVLGQRLILGVPTEQAKLDRNQTLPSGAIAGSTFSSSNSTASSVTNAVALHTANQSGNPSGHVYAETGNNSAGASGDIILRTGTATTTRGSVKLAGLTVETNAVSLNPISDQTQTVGSASKKYREYYGRDIFLYTAANVDATWIRGTVTTSPSGASVDGGIQKATNSVTPLALYTPNRDNGSQDILIETGNVSAGEQSSGKISLKTGNVQTGTSKNIELITGSVVGGTRGKLVYKDGSEGTVGHVLTSTDANGTATWQANPSAPQVAYIKNVQASGGAAETLTVGSYGTRTLNTLTDPNSIVTSLSANQFVLPIGTYEIEIKAPFITTAAGGSTAKVKLRNITDSSDTIIGSPAFDSNISGSTDVLYCFAEGIFTIASPKTFEAQMRASATANGGAPATFGDDEVYTQIRIQKIA